MAHWRMKSRDGDEGAVLLMALIFIGVMGLLIAAVLTTARTTVASSVITRQYTERALAADAGLQYAVQQVKVRSQFCESGSDTDLTVPSSFIPADQQGFKPTVTIKCRMTSGTSLGSLGYAIITHQTTNQNFDPGNHDLTIDGPVFFSALPSSLNGVTVSNGDVTIGNVSGACPSKPAGLTVTAPFAFGCTAGAAPQAPDLLPTAVPAAHAANPAPAGGCSIFKPGKYSGAGSVALTSQNYFASGVYYFDNVGTMDLTGKSLFGGNRATNETKIVANSDAIPCSNDLAVPGTVGSGVKFILGGNSAIVTGNNGFVELYARQGGPAGEGVQGVSLMTVPTSPPAVTPAWNPSPVDYNTVRVGESGCGGGGSNIGFVSHGYTVIPGGLVCLRTNKDEVQYLSGIDAGALRIGTSNNVQGLTISVASQSFPRTLAIVATVTDPTATGTAKKTTGQATVTVDRNPAHPSFDISAWRID